ncbi:ABC transporter permease [Clostridium sp. chh4-2]|uniref:ABC transporter permease n=1 Tax=Clostridium sp. chh4-2 TaxID=2067550 RepID=UPI000CCFBD60|nr:ABC transporter permease [Clostridium sp. chh4-2]PNV59661.1 ABC transporter permease [Clostridium sp. chh4-2]PNV60471.1 ABC transporter permease [Clostridium sp. chh4-2]PNV61781.1 ABC transporter permease [Clostridium sp. chh4-2]
MMNTKLRKFFGAMFSRKIVIFAFVVVVLFIFTALFAPLIAPYDPNFADFAAYLAKPSGAHLLGTDSYGRDVMSRIIFGARVSLIIGVLAVIIACAIGTFLGMVAGYFGGIVDDVINRMTEAIRAIPQVVLAMALTAVFGSGIKNLAIILGVSSMAGYVRMMRGQVLSIKQSDYIMAGKLQGNSNFQLMFKHILPNSISPIIVMMTQQVGTTILSEAGLSFLGLGISAPTASWGSMVSEGRLFLLQSPAFALAPGICVAILVICLNMLGDGVRDALDPRLRGEI